MEYEYTHEDQDFANEDQIAMIESDILKAKAALARMSVEGDDLF